jgi:hypothetical protein
MTLCPPADQLLGFAAGDLSGEASALIEAHIDGCADCRRALSSAMRGGPRAAGFGRYRIDGVLGAGGMGVVYRAWDPQLARPVAIKVVKQTRRDPAQRARLVREAQSLARLSHPHVCQVHDVGTESDAGAEVWVAMELIEGMTLRRWAEPPRDAAELLDALLGAAEGLAAAHAAGIVHRDVKPENVLITREGRAVVTDFGLARVELPVDPDGSTLTGDGGLTSTGAVVGTPAYLAPEQLTGGPIDARVDQFAWAVMAWELLTGMRPFPSLAGARLDAIRAGVTPPAGLEPRLATALTRALAASPRDRFATLRELIDAIRAPAVVRSRRGPMIAAAGVLLAATGGAALWWQTGSGGTTPPARSGLQGDPPAAGTTPSPGPGDGAPPAPRPPAQVARVELLHAVPATVAVSSTVDNPKILPAHLVDGDPATAWNSRTGDLVGAWIAFRVPRDVHVDQIRMSAGFTHTDADGDLFTKNPRIQRVRVSRDGVVVLDQRLDPESRKLQELAVDAAGGDFRIEVTEIMRGSKRTWREVCVSELEVWGTVPSTMPVGATTPTVRVGSLGVP